MHEPTGPASQVIPENGLRAAVSEQHVRRKTPREGKEIPVQQWTSRLDSLFGRRTIQLCEHVADEDISCSVSTPITHPTRQQTTHAEVGRRRRSFSSSR